ncbi:hypothetical protein SAMN05216337_10156 [Bradyrhizobium brasilense]|uniref:Uncharacterized protein n=1 Tax=Bradyrhizobium brasilense TaxID=1419277 RepID=A0A1G6XEI9_9BRAD|nr:hypothetical protein [Bradyrhizobium brasilense]SDD76580.1 hypothetical protein SAMN05216337_10156 [Bradyrhizobium brasilense]
MTDQIDPLRRLSGTAAITLAASQLALDGTTEGQPAKSKPGVSRQPAGGAVSRQLRPLAIRLKAKGSKDGYYPSLLSNSATGARNDLVATILYGVNCTTSEG